jgi:hypothetical protein
VDSEKSMTRWPVFFAVFGAAACTYGVLTATRPDEGAAWFMLAMAAATEMLRGRE